MPSSLKRKLRGLRQASDTDFTSKLTKPHGSMPFIRDNDSIVPTSASVRPAARTVKGAALTICPDAPYRLVTTRQDQPMGELLAFIKSRPAGCRCGREDLVRSQDRPSRALR
jgi:hypothetical protein